MAAAQRDAGSMITRTHLRQHVEAVRQRPALPAAFVYPCDAASLHLALACAFSETLAPILVGPELGIRDAAGKAGIEIGQLPIADTGTAPQDAVARAVALARSGAVAALVRGSLSSEFLLRPLDSPSVGLRGLRRLSHASFVELPQLPRGVLVADTLLDVAPSLAARKDIVHNTVEFALALGIAAPRVALVAAAETVSLALGSTADAAALAALGAEGAFGTAIVDGPLNVDTALFERIAKAHGREAPVAGHADMLIAPSTEVASLVVQALCGLGGGLAAGVVLGASVPIVSPLPNDTMEAQIASCALAARVATANRQRASVPSAAAPAVDHTPHAIT